MARRGFSDEARKSAAIARRIKAKLGQAAYEDYKRTGRIPPGLDTPSPGLVTTAPPPVVQPKKPSSSSNHPAARHLREIEETMDELGIDREDMDIEDVRSVGRMLSAEIQKDPNVAHARAQFEAARQNVKTGKDLTPQVQRRMQALLDEYYKQRRMATTRNLRDIRRMGGQINYDNNVKSSDAKRRLDNLTNFVPTDWLEAASETPLKTATFKHKLYAGQYVFHDQPSESILKVNEDPALGTKEALLHEFTHRVGHVLPHILRMESDFIQERTGGQPSEDLLADKGAPGIAYGWKDKFVTPYMGRDYGGIGWEILAMGMEDAFFGKYNVEFYDQEYYEFTLGLLASA